MTFMIVILHFGLALAATALILDLFINSEILAQIAIFIITIWTSCNILINFDVHIFWYITVFILSLIFNEVIYFYIWRAFLVKFIAKNMTRKAAKEISDEMIGYCGKIEINNGQPILHYSEEYLPIDSSCSASLKEGTLVEIVSVRNGCLIVKKI